MANPVVISIQANFRARDNPSAYYFVDDKHGVVKDAGDRDHDIR